MNNTFHNTTTYTEEEYIKFQKFHMNSLHKITFWINMILAAFLVIVGIFMIVKNQNNWGYAYIGLGIVYLLYRIFLPSQTAKFMMGRNEEMANTKNEYTFTDNQIEIQNEELHSSAPYTDVDKLYETKENFYLYMKNRQVFLLDKKGFEEQELNLFSEQMKQKLDKRYRVK